jgi:hypothetical protein
MSATLTSQVLKVTNGVCGVTHTATAGRTLCGRDAAGMLVLSEMGGWERMGWDAASKGACQRCAAAAAKRVAQAQAQDLNMWGTPRALVNADEYCPECEREVPRHYSTCPDYRA